MHSAWKRPLTAAEVARSTEDAESFGRNLRDWQHELRRLSNRKEFVLQIAEAPPLIQNRLGDDGQSDAYLAAYVEWLCERHGIPTPDWLSETRRTASKAWYDYPPLWPDSLVHAPGPFRRRGIFTRPEDVLRFRPGRPKVSERHKQEKNAERQRRYRARIRQKLERLKLLESGSDCLDS